MRQCYVRKIFRGESRALIDTVNGIIEDYQQQGYVLTVRQLYYQLVARAIIANTMAEYKRVAGLINDGKLAGLIDWDAIEDRTRAFERRQRWHSGEEILQAAANSYHQDMWVGQEFRVFVIIEKEALVGVLSNVCYKYDVPLLAARGYPSGTVLREFAVRDVLPAVRQGKQVVILHLGDHDPSGIDMTRDLEERIDLFAGYETNVTVNRIALTMDQIEDQNPPENPAKTTDARFNEYRRKYGDASWELDALTPSYLSDLVESKVEALIDHREWDAIAAEIDQTRAEIAIVARRFRR